MRASDVMLVADGIENTKLYLQEHGRKAGYFGIKGGPCCLMGALTMQFGGKEPGCLPKDDEAARRQYTLAKFAIEDAIRDLHPHCPGGMISFHDNPVTTDAEVWEVLDRAVILFDQKWQREQEARAARKQERDN